MFSMTETLVGEGGEVGGAGSDFTRAKGQFRNDIKLGLVHFIESKIKSLSGRGLGWPGLLNVYIICCKIWLQRCVSDKLESTGQVREYGRTELFLPFLRMDSY